MSTDTLSPPALSDIRSEGYFTRSLADADPAVFGGVQQELKREQTQIELIASENIVSKAGLEAQGSVFTNKYAEGYPGKRYYQGCHPSDEVETLGIEPGTRAYSQIAIHSHHLPSRSGCRRIP